MEKKFIVPTSDWKAVNLPNIKFILAEAKETVKSQMDNNDKITARSFSILQILIPVLAGLIVAMVRENSIPTLNQNYILKLLVIIVVGLFAIMIYLCKIILPRMSMFLGREPRDLCISGFLEDFTDSDDAQRALILNEIEANQLKIDYNNKQILHRTKALQRSCYAIAILCFIAMCVVFSNF